jgi:hypothetical protein
MPRRIYPVVLFIIALLLGGCASEIPEPTTYYVPPSDTAGVTGFVKGSQLWTLLGVKPVVYAYAVNGERVKGGYHAWQDLLPLRPGFVDLEVACANGATIQTITVPFEVVAGETYEIQFNGDTLGGAPQKYCDVWVTNLNSGMKVSPLSRIVLRP